ncbi:MAG: OmpA family protein [Bacteroidota bacterium]
MRIIGILLFIFTIVSCSTAQKGYSTTNKKAIVLFEEGKKAPEVTRDPQTGRPNYKEGIRLMDKALEKDPNFWEAHVVAAEFAEYANLADIAIDHYVKALAINPEHSPSGSTYFYLGNLYYVTGKYDDCIKTLEFYVSNPRANPDMVLDAEEIMASAAFAKEAVKNPTKFEPINLGPGVNTADPEYFPTITVDGKTILFTRLINDSRVEGSLPKQEDFYVSNLSDNNAWQTAIPMPNNINTVRNEGAPTISADGRSLIFVACSMGDVLDYGDDRSGRGSCDLFITKRLGSKWSNPENLPGKINSGSWESQPSLSADGKTLYFVKRVSSRGMTQDADIFMSTLQDDGTWGLPARLSNNVNTPMMEESVLIHPDGKTLYFSSRGHQGMGGLDIYVSRLDATGVWGKAENLGYPINTRYDENSLMVSSDGEIAFFASDREGGYGDLDIYYFEMPENLRPTKTLYFDGLVYNIDNKRPVPGKFSLIDLKTGKEVIRSEADGITGAFTVTLPVDREYALSVSYPGYNDFSAHFNMTIPDEQEVVHMDVPMVPLTSLEPVALRNVFFDLASANLRTESSVELNKLRDFLKTNATLKIELGGHTDTRGDAAENQVLSQNRAKAVFDYLVKQGIDAKRMTYKGYGETKTIISDEQISKMTTEKEKEKAHQENRRTEYRIIQ